MYTKFSDAVFFTTFVVTGFLSSIAFLYLLIALINPSGLAAFNQTNFLADLSLRQSVSLILMSGLIMLGSASAMVWRLTDGNKKTSDNRGLQTAPKPIDAG